jgi:hypothetical protein
MGSRRMRVEKISLRARILASANASPSGDSRMSPEVTVAKPISSAAHHPHAPGRAFGQAIDVVAVIGRFVQIFQEASQVAWADRRQGARRPRLAGGAAQLDVLGLSLAGQSAVNAVHHACELGRLALARMGQPDTQIGHHSPRVPVHDDDAGPRKPPLRCCV